jgi:starch phosphorylase
MPTLRRFTVVARLPAQLERLRELAYNMWWAWNPVARELFHRIDPRLWREVHGNPIELLGRTHQDELEELAKDEAFISHLDAVCTLFQRYMSREGWFGKTFPQAQNAHVAYFSMEFGIHESLPIYSGGLGVLAGDHLKAASDLGLPLVGVGLAYTEGYFRQALNDDGWQAERYPINDWHHLPVQPVMGQDGKRLIIHVQYPGRVVHAQLWRVQVGRVPLYLLDTNIDLNPPEDRIITGSLYGGDKEFRVKQEIMLGIGGIHALDALGLRPTVCHLNEGHSAFLSLERIRRAMESAKVPFHVAAEACASCNVFTTHTPVPAGIDRFDPELVRKYLEPYREALGIGIDELLALGKETPAQGTAFSMANLAIRTSKRYNGVAKLHGKVSRGLWSSLWPEVPEDEVPIGSVTNGTHVPSFVPRELGELFARYVGSRWAEAIDDAALWQRVYEIPDQELWQVRENQRHKLVRFARKSLRTSLERRSASPEAVARAEETLDSKALTIGFARRFATYKRASLLFSNPERIRKLISQEGRPVQFIFAGKAHPQDTPGKELIRQIVQLSRDPALEGRVVFLEDYDMSVARAMVSGVDVWLNTPRRPHEASGTSGMKAAANGALNVSILDGWWDEAWADHGREVGWAIGQGEEYDDGQGDGIEAELLHGLLEREVIPLFYSRETRDGIPRGWIRKMKNAIARLVPTFNTQRMVKEYAERLYVPSHGSHSRMMANGLAEAKELCSWKEHVRSSWSKVAVRDVVLRSPSELKVGEALEAETLVELGGLSPKDVSVELYVGRLHGQQEVRGGRSERMQLVDKGVGGVYRFSGRITVSESGAHAFSVRLIPHDDRLATRYEVGLIRWA